MAKNESVKICRLCHSSSDLVESHYVPKAAYEILRRTNQSPPVIISDKVAIQSSRQMTNKLLCRDCEDRFNRNGEGWVLKHCFRGDEGFKLREIIESQSIAFDGGKLQAYSAATIPEISTEKLAYFAASMIWRAAIHEWRLERIPASLAEIGPKYKEELRLYLLEESPFPSNAVVWVSVSTSEHLYHAITPVYGEKDQRQFWKYHFTLLGINFIFLLGNRLDRDARNMCTYRSPQKWIYSGADVDDNLIRDLVPSMRTSRPVGSLAKGRSKDK